MLTRSHFESFSNEGAKREGDEADNDAFYDFLEASAAMFGPHDYEYNLEYDAAKRHLEVKLSFIEGYLGFDEEFDLGGHIKAVYTREGTESMTLKLNMTDWMCCDDFRSIWDAMRELDLKRIEVEFPCSKCTSDLYHFCRRVRSTRLEEFRLECFQIPDSESIDELTSFIWFHERTLKKVDLGFGPKRSKSSYGCRFGEVLWALAVCPLESLILRRLPVMAKRDMIGSTEGAYVFEGEKKHVLLQ